MNTSEIIENSKKIKEKIDILNLRIRALEGKISPIEISKGAYVEKGFKQLLHETLENINKTQELDKNIYNDIRNLLGKLSELNILPKTAAWPRRYFYEKAYYRHWEKPKERFIYKALNDLYISKGFSEGWSENNPEIQDVYEEVTKCFIDFYSLKPDPGWRAIETEEASKGLDAINKSALKLGRTFIRLFFVEGLAAELLEAWKSYEKFLYLASPVYRDHFLHLFYDFLLGCKILDGLLYKIHSNWKFYTGDENITIEEIRIRIMRSWLIASLFHDIGYTAEKINSFQDVLEDEFFSKIPGFSLSDLKLTPKGYLEKEINNFLELLSYMSIEDEFSFDFNDIEISLKGQISKKYSRELMSSAVTLLLTEQLHKFDHGVMSALFLLIAIKIDIHEFTMEDDKLPYKKRRENYEKQRAELLEDAITGILAISFHNIRQTDCKGLTIDFRSHPITFMLMLCDELHEWDRSPEHPALAPQTLRAVYGFELFPELKDPRTLFDDMIKITDADNKTYEIESFYFYLKNRMKKISSKDELQNAIYPIKNIIQKFSPGSNSSKQIVKLKFEIENYLNKQDKMNFQVKTLLKTLLFNLNNDVITLTYVGGDPAKKDSKEDRVQHMRRNFYNLFYNNLSYGPAICILHGYEEDAVNIFFTAEYSPTLRQYRISDEFKW